jgi:nucleoid DNA-binding protein
MPEKMEYQEAKTELNKYVAQMQNELGNYSLRVGVDALCKKLSEKLSDKDQIKLQTYKVTLPCFKK